MDLADVFHSKSEDERIAFRALIEREDEIFNLQPHEDGDLGAHVRADIPRFQLINARVALLTAVSNRKQDKPQSFTQSALSCLSKPESLGQTFLTPLGVDIDEKYLCLFLSFGVWGRGRSAARTRPCSSSTWSIFCNRHDQPDHGGPDDRECRRLAS